MIDKTKPIRPIYLRKKDAEISIGQAINSAAAANELTFFELEDIIFKYYVEVQRGAERERRDAEAEYKRQIEIYIKQKEKEMKEDGKDNSTSDS